MTLFLFLLLVVTNVAWLVVFFYLGHGPARLNKALLKRRGVLCCESGCTELAELDVTVQAENDKGKKVGPKNVRRICQEHAKELAKKLAFLPGAQGTIEGVDKVGEAFKINVGTLDTPEAHQLDLAELVAAAPDTSAPVPDQAAFNRSLGLVSGPPDLEVLKPQPLDDVSAAIEAAYRKKA